jgi:hypothetical protein
VEVYRFDPAKGLSQYATQADGRFGSQLTAAEGYLVLTAPDGVLAIDPVSGRPSRSTAGIGPGGTVGPDGGRAALPPF